MVREASASRALVSGDIFSATASKSALITQFTLGKLCTGCEIEVAISFC
jgi:hypothetical protein